MYYLDLQYYLWGGAGLQIDVAELIQVEPPNNGFFQLTINRTAKRLSGLHSRGTSTSLWEVNITTKLWVIHLQTIPRLQLCLVIVVIARVTITRVNTLSNTGPSTLQKDNKANVWKSRFTLWE